MGDAWLDGPLNLEDGNRLLMVDPMRAMHIRASSNISMDLAIKANRKRETKSFEEMVPPYLHDF
jgi:hypothetical protein